MRWLTWVEKEAKISDRVIIRSPNTETVFRREGLQKHKTSQKKHVAWVIRLLTIVGGSRSTVETGSMLDPARLSLISCPEGCCWLDCFTIPVEPMAAMPGSEEKRSWLE